jgi:hypothetical protein
LILLALQELFTRAKAALSAQLPQEPEGQSALLVSMYRAHAMSDQLARKIARGGVTDLLSMDNPMMEDPRLSLMFRLEEDIQNIDKILNEKMCGDMNVQRAWSVVEFLKGQREFISTLEQSMPVDNAGAMAVKNFKRRYLEVEDTILNKLVRPLTEVPHTTFLQEMRLRHLPFDMNEKLKQFFELYAFIHGAPDVAPK